MVLPGRGNYLWSAARGSDKRLDRREILQIAVNLVGSHCRIYLRDFDCGVPFLTTSASATHGKAGPGIANMSSVLVNIQVRLAESWLIVEESKSHIDRLCRAVARAQDAINRSRVLIEDRKAVNADLTSGMAPIIAKSRMTRSEVNNIVRSLRNYGIECELSNGSSVH
jgi:hypothetical protein